MRDPLNVVSHQVAVGEADMALGGDQGGSIRMPAAWSGIVGLKPTYGLIPYTGIPTMEQSLDHVGPMAKTVTDCALLLQVYITKFLMKVIADFLRRSKIS